MKSILITGSHSYIGSAVRDYLNKWPDRFKVSVKDTMNWEPKIEEFTSFDVVFNVAGIAHVKENKQNIPLYYAVNRDLVIKIAKAAKDAGVGHFILMSSMSVYGLTSGKINKDTRPIPKTHYGTSKLMADLAISEMENESFKVAILRPPMVYGKKCKGNYQRLKAFALKVPIFPNYYNQRSMIFIGNLCEFIKQCIETEKRGIFFPQNAKYIKTYEMVKIIAEEHGKKIRLTSIFNSIIAKCHIDIIDKVFGTLVYEQVDQVSKYDLLQSIILSKE